MTSLSHAKFDPARAQEYAKEARIGLAGYDACHELSACILSAALKGGGERRVLVVGAGGTAGEIAAAARLEPSWRFVAVDPSGPMLALAESRVREEGIEDRVAFVRADVSALPPEPAYDAALMIGVLHHVPERRDKARLLEDIARRLAPGGSLVLAGNCGSYDGAPLLQAAWANRWRLHGASEDEVRTKLARIQAGAAPPESEDAVALLLTEAGFAAPERFFSSLFWGAWHTRRADQA
ncbi:class I SAM-dependent methyltransferase [Pikeienuella sp. HZG-20]|uniref:SAM-dependent methyltransferase n=1 Tax=Paludibacillus litoralis TaxID=3133267 RepID=UPI0030EF5B98